MKKKVIVVKLSPRALAYIDALVRMEGFGESRAEVITRFIWDRLNELIAKPRLVQK